MIRPHLCKRAICQVGVALIFLLKKYKLPESQKSTSNLILNLCINIVASKSQYLTVRALNNIQFETMLNLFLKSAYHDSKTLGVKVSKLAFFPQDNS